MDNNIQHNTPTTHSREEDSTWLPPIHYGRKRGRPSTGVECINRAVYGPKDLFKRVDAQASELGVSFSGAVVLALRLWLSRSNGDSDHSPAPLPGYSPAVPGTEYRVAPGTLPASCPHCAATPSESYMLLRSGNGFKCNRCGTFAWFFDRDDVLVVEREED